MRLLVLAAKENGRHHRVAKKGCSISVRKGKENVRGRRTKESRRRSGALKPDQDEDVCLKIVLRSVKYRLSCPVHVELVVGATVLKHLDYFLSVTHIS